MSDSLPYDHADIHITDAHASKNNLLFLPRFSACLLVFLLFSSVFYSVPVVMAKPTNEKFSWHLEDVDIRLVIQQVAKLTGQSFVVDPRVQGKIHLYADAAESPEEIYQLFTEALRVMGYVTQTVNNHTHILPMQHAAGHASTSATANIILSTFALGHLSGESVQAAIKPLLPEWVRLSFLEDNNHLLFVGDVTTYKNIHLVLTQLQQAIPKQAAFQFQEYQVKNNRLDVLLPSLRALLASQQYPIQLQRVDSRAGVDDIGIEPSALASNKKQDETPALSIQLIAMPAQQRFILYSPDVVHQKVRQWLPLVDVAPQQIIVQVMIAEVDHQYLQTKGMQWQSFSASPSSLLSLQLLPQPKGLKLELFQPLHIAIESLVQEQRAEVLARPLVRTLNGQLAEVEVGQRVSVTHSSHEAGAVGSQPYQTFAREDVSLSLAVTPTIINQDEIELEITHQNNSLVNPSSTSTTPLVNVSRLNTRVRAKDGETIVLGGIIQKQTHERSRKPAWKRFSWLGRWLRHRHQQSHKKVLFILLKPLRV